MEQLRALSHRDGQVEEAGGAVLALPCRSADETLWLSSLGVGHGGVRLSPGGEPCCRQHGRWHTHLQLPGLIPGDLHPAGAGSPPVGWHSPCSREQGVPQHLFHPTPCRSCSSSRGRGAGAVPHDKGVIDMLVCGTANLEQCPLFIPREAWPYWVSSS